MALQSWLLWNSTQRHLFSSWGSLASLACASLSSGMGCRARWPAEAPCLLLGAGLAGPQRPESWLTPRQLQKQGRWHSEADLVRLFYSGGRKASERWEEEEIFLLAFIFL